MGSDLQLDELRSIRVERGVAAQPRRGDGDGRVEPVPKALAGYNGRVDVLRAAEKNGGASEMRELIRKLVADRPGGFVAQILGRELRL